LELERCESHKTLNEDIVIPIKTKGQESFPPISEERESYTNCIPGEEKTKKSNQLPSQLETRHLLYPFLLESKIMLFSGFVLNKGIRY